MTAIKEESPRVVPPPVLPRTAPAKVMIVSENVEDYMRVVLAVRSTTTTTKII